MTPTLARRLREAREAKGLTQGQVAAQIGTHHVQVGKWERGVVTPRVHTQERLAELYGVSLAWLHGATDATEKVARETKTPAPGAGAHHPTGLTSAGLAALWGVRSMQVHLSAMMDQILSGDVDRFVTTLTSEQAEVVVSEQLLHRAMEDAGASQTHHSANGRRAAKDEKQPPEQPPDGSERRRRA